MDDTLAKDTSLHLIHLHIRSGDNGDIIPLSLWLCGDLMNELYLNTSYYFYLCLDCIELFGWMILFCVDVELIFP